MPAPLFRVGQFAEQVFMLNVNFVTSSVKITAPFNNLRTLKFEAQPTNTFFATVNQMFGGSSQPPTTAERAILKSSSTVQTIATKQCPAVVGKWVEPPNI